MNPKVMAEGEGFEPPVPFQVQRFSRPPVSTAHTSLRAFFTTTYLWIPNTQRLLAKMPLVNSQSTRGLTNMRTQTGNVILRSKVWYVRFYNRDGKRVTQQLEPPDAGSVLRERRSRAAGRPPGESVYCFEHFVNHPLC